MAGMLVLYLVLITLMMSVVVVGAIGEEFSYRNQPPIRWYDSHTPRHKDPITVKGIGYRNNDYIIINDPGGTIREYIGRTATGSKTSTSSWTAYATHPARWCSANKNVCVTDKAIFGFHAASSQSGTNCS